MARSSTWILCSATMVVGIVIGVTAEWWSLTGSARAEQFDRATAERLYNELSAPDSALLASSDYLAKISRLTTPSVVHIESERHTKRGIVEETGSGVIMQVDKMAGVYVITNRHVIDGTDLANISIQLYDGRVVHPTRVWSDKATDVAAMKLPVEDVNIARWGDSRKLEIGHIVLAMGSPFGLSQSVTFGIISAKGRRSLELGSGSDVLNQDFLQTDAAINPGNSGGPLINLHGQVIGINTAIASNSGGNEGIGFSIPSYLVRQVVDQLLQYGKVTRAYLGVKLDPKFNSAAATRLKLDRVRGARVLEVYPNTPASRANLQFDDVVLIFDGIEVQDENHLINLVSLMPPDKKAKLTVQRAGKKIVVEVSVGDRAELEQRSEVTPSRPDHGVHVEMLGLTLHPIEPEVAGQLGFPKNATSLLVLKVDPRSPAAGEVRLYDLIAEVARSRVSTVSGLNKMLDDLPGDSVLLKVERVQSDGVQSSLVLVPRS